MCSSTKTSASEVFMFDSIALTEVHLVIFVLTLVQMCWHNHQVVLPEPLVSNQCNGGCSMSAHGAPTTRCRGYGTSSQYRVVAVVLCTTALQHYM